MGVARPRPRAVEGVELLIEQPILFQRRDRLGSARAAICSVGHDLVRSNVARPHEKNSISSMVFRTELRQVPNDELSFLAMTTCREEFSLMPLLRHQRGPQHHAGNP